MYSIAMSTFARLSQTGGARRVRNSPSEPLYGVQELRDAWRLPWERTVLRSDLVAVCWAANRFFIFSSACNAADIVRFEEKLQGSIGKEMRWFSGCPVTAISAWSPVFRS